jgi:hypothetical protein
VVVVGAVGAVEIGVAIGVVVSGDVAVGVDADVVAQPMAIPGQRRLTWTTRPRSPHCRRQCVCSHTYNRMGFWRKMA